MHSETRPNTSIFENLLRHHEGTSSTTFTAFLGGLDKCINFLIHVLTFLRSFMHLSLLICYILWTGYLPHQIWLPVHTACTVLKQEKHASSASGQGTPDLARWFLSQKVLGSEAVLACGAQPCHLLVMDGHSIPHIRQVYQMLGKLTVNFFFFNSATQLFHLS